MLILVRKTRIVIYNKIIQIEVDVKAKITANLPFNRFLLWNLNCNHSNYKTRISPIWDFGKLIRVTYIVKLGCVDVFHAPCLKLDSNSPLSIETMILKTTQFKKAIMNDSPNKILKFCRWEGFDANELLCQIVVNVPESLETMKIRMDYKDLWIFSADSLRKFFEE
ncbi:hypothetical protein Glove_521g24 [Diversispora epigaea]|uniref:Uncharacterized protein n=1 Tax=Diversispora epigaea TaxID=1348612 RepID=A0A397GK51_9GLOM|nr:hypothetical protein Glove_521g24 [Diversispora epigaea]